MNKQENIIMVLLFGIGYNGPMTCLLSCSNKNGGVLVSDSWNHLPSAFQSYCIRKTAYNAAHSIVIAQAGVNCIQKSNGTSLRILDIMQSVCDSFDSKNVEAMQYNLYAGTRYFLHQLAVDPSHPFASLEYIVLYHDGHSIRQRMYRYLREWYPNMRGEWEYAEISRDLTHASNGFQFGALGTYGLEYQLRNRSRDFSRYTMNQMRTFLLQQAWEQVEREAVFSNRQRRVGKPLKTITMDINGRIQTD